MPNSHPRRTVLRIITLVAAPTLLALSLAASPATARARASVSLNSVGSRYVGDTIPIKGYTSHAPRGRHLLKLQTWSGTRWTTRAKKYVRNGPYKFPSQTATAAGLAKFRTVLIAHHRRIGVSNVISVPVALRPAPAPAPPPPPPGPPVYPDLRIKNLTKCGAGDMAATGGTCFKIDNTSIPGKTLLKFGVITLNMGPTPGSTGPAEITAHRSSAATTDWTAVQNVYDANGRVALSLPIAGIQFFYATDGHNHWHIRDFDGYDLLDATGTTVAVGEKHGYCIQDNTTWDPWQGLPGVPPDSGGGVYTEELSCGHGNPDATSIIHGLSVGWGDTYPTSLPNQAIDITGIPDGTYTVRVHADVGNYVKESNEDDNTASVQVQIGGGGTTVTVVAGSAAGGV